MLVYVFAPLLLANSPEFATIALRPNGIIGPNERHHTPKLLASAVFSATALHMGAGALTDCESAAVEGMQPLAVVLVTVALHPSQSATGTTSSMLLCAHCTC